MLYGIAVFSWVEKYANIFISLVKVLNNFMFKFNQC